MIADWWGGLRVHTFMDQNERASRTANTASIQPIIMSSSKLHTLHKQLVSAFTSRPSDLKTSGRLLAELKVRLIYFSYALTSHRREPLRQVVLIETGLIFPQGDYSTQDLVIARECRFYRFTL